VIHRDLKPENLLLSQIPTNLTDVHLKVIDFGLSTIKEELDVLTTLTGT
jgi:serine/threonine protein kinase